MWDLPGPGIEPVSPVLAGGFSTAEPLGKPLLLSMYSFRAKFLIFFPGIHPNWLGRIMELLFGDVVLEKVLFNILIST